MLQLHAIERLYQPIWLPEYLEVSGSTVELLYNYLKNADNILYERVIRKRNKRLKQFKNRLNIVLEQIESDSTIIDLGCNVGWNSFELYRKGMITTGIDTDLSVIQLANCLVNEYSLEINKINFSVVERKKQLIHPIENAYNYCLCFLVLHHYFNVNWKEDGLFNTSGESILTNINNKCETCFIQLRLGVIDEEIFMDYVINYIGFKSVEVFKLPSNAVAHIHPIYKFSM